MITKFQIFENKELKFKKGDLVKRKGLSHIFKIIDISDQNLYWLQNLKDGQDYGYVQETYLEPAPDFEVDIYRYNL